MPAFAFDHVHLLSEDPAAAAAWYSELLGGEVRGSDTVRGAPQIRVAFTNASLIVRGRRKGEAPVHRAGLEWGVDHFGLRVDGPLDPVCDRLRERGVRFLLEPVDFNPATRIAFIEGPDGVVIELLERRPAA
jgi:catechol 2,3-dioxygenase-like lactoylglutathione lyase family enzyme